MSLNQAEKSQLKNFVNSPQWLTVQKIQDELIEKIKEENCVKDTEWETARATIEKEAKIMGIRRFIQELFLNIQ